MELLVVVGVMGLITSVVVYNQSTFNDTISVDTVIADIDLELRQAQVYGVSVREFAPETGEFNLAYGVSFDLSNDLAFVSFADRGVLNRRYDGTHAYTTVEGVAVAQCSTSPTSECTKVNIVPRGNRITRICVIQDVGSNSCTPNVDRVDITFRRPDPKADVFIFDGGGGEQFPDSEGVRVEVTSPGGQTKGISIYRTGQISLQ